MRHLRDDLLARKFGRISFWKNENRTCNAIGENLSFGTLCSNDHILEFPKLWCLLH